MTGIVKLSAEANPATWHISLPFLGEEEIIGAYVLAGKEELAIIDPGPSSTAEALLTRLRDAGFDPRNVTHLLLTHIHLDHGGAAGMLLRAMPKATVYVHNKGAPHLIDPTKFIASASRIYGERMQELWGEIVPVPERRVRVLDDGDIFTVADRRLEIHYTPGHAIHHVVFYDVHTGELFTGDAAGVRLQNIDCLRPPTPPPDIDLETWYETITKLKQLRPDVLYLAHYAGVRNPTAYLERLREKLISWGDFVLSAMRDGKEEQEIIRMLTQQGNKELQSRGGNEHDLRRYDLAANHAMCVQGLMRYWRKKHPERL